MTDKTLIADVVTTWLALAERRPTLCFAVDRVHARTLQAEFEAKGVPCGYLDAHSTRPERDEVRKQFGKGALEVVCNVGVLTTGVDWDVRCIILARPTKSEILYTQIIGRGLRIADGKADCLILDHSDTTLRLGFVTDIHHDRLSNGRLEDGNAGGGDAEPAKPKECPKCHYVRAPGISSCPSCGFVPAVATTVQTLPGELVDLSAARRKANKGDAWPEKVAFMRQLRAYGVEKGMKPGWAANKYREKFGVWPNDPRVSHVGPAAAVTPEVRSWIKSRAIAFAKRRGAK